MSKESGSEMDSTPGQGAVETVEMTAKMCCLFYTNAAEEGGEAESADSRLEGRSPVSEMLSNDTAGKREIILGEEINLCGKPTAALF